MNIKITYPAPEKQRTGLADVRRVAKWAILAAVYACPIVNLNTGTPAWSVVVLWSLYILWRFVLAPDLVEYNRISQIAKLMIAVSILLLLIGVLLAPGWVGTVIPIVGFCGLMLIGGCFFANVGKQKQNMMPMLLLALAAVLVLITMMIFWPDKTPWTVIVLGAVAGGILLSSALVLGGELPREFKKRFHTI